MNTPNTTTNTMNTIMTNTQTSYLSKELARTARCPGNEIGKIMTDRGVQPLTVRITGGGQHRYTWGQDAMDAALAWRVEQDARLLRKQNQRSRMKIEKEMKKPAPEQLLLPLPQPDVTETFPTIERRKDDAQLIAIHEQLVALNNNMLALLAIWTKE